jgi:NADH pyrophosphatase-like rudimentary NUDIX domain
MPSPRPNALATVNLDRLGDQRKDDVWLAEALGASTTRVHPLHEGLVAALGDRAATLTVDRARTLVPDLSFVLLGSIDGTVHFSIDVSGAPRRALEEALHEDAMLVGLRDAATTLGADDANLLAFASGIATTSSAVVAAHRRSPGQQATSATAMPVATTVSRVRIRR